MVQLATKNQEIVANLAMRTHGDVFLRQKFLLEDTARAAVRSIDPEGELLTTGEAEEAVKIILQHVMR